MADRSDRATRGRLSSIDLLPEEARDDVIWAIEQLAARNRTQADILFEFNDRLEAKGLEPISAAAFNRKAVRLAAAQRRMQEARAMFQGLASQFTAADVDENTIILGEYLKTLIVELLDNPDTTPKQAAELARAFQSAVNAQKVSSDRRRKLEAEFSEKTEQAIERVVAEAGLTADRAAQIRMQVLGVRATPALQGPG